MSLRVSLLVTLTLALPACSHSSSNMAGHWRGVRAEGVRSDMVDVTNAYATHMRIEVNGNVITVTTPKDTRTDHYALVEEDKTHTVIATDLDGAGDPQTFLFTDPSTMKWAVNQTGVVVFAKE